MKKYFIAFFLLACTKVLLAQNKSALPAAYLGHWQKGSFSLTSFEEYNGKYVGPANETSVSYVLEENGIAKEYFISNTNSYNCRMQILGYREGRIVLNAANNSFEFQPATGYYSSLTCMSKTTNKKPYGEKDLYPNYKVTGFLEKDSQGLPVLVTRKNKDSEGLRFKKIR